MKFKPAAELSIASKIGVQKRFLTMTLYGSGHGRDHYYRIKQIPKSNGKVRTIHAISGRLRTLQSKTLEYLSAKYPPTAFAKGFVKGGSIIENAKVHRNKNLLIKLDIKDFFPTISFARVMGMFQAVPFEFSKDEAIILAQTCCLDNNGSIPQGGVTSPYISNMICRKLDSRLSQLAKVKRANYTRYADDITFSTNNSFDIQKFLEKVEGIIIDESFEVNESKTKLLRKSNRQIVTGVVVNEGLNVNRKYINNIRALLHNCYESGLTTQMTKSAFKDRRNTCSNIGKTEGGDYYSYRGNQQLTVQEAKELFLSHVHGRIQFVGQVVKANKDLNVEHYNNRMEIYRKLLDKYLALRIKEKIRGPQYYHAKKELEGCKDVDLITNIKEFTLDELNNKVIELSVNDPRFFTKSFSISDLDKYKNEVINILEYPPFNNTLLIDLLSKLKDSSSILGGLVHDILEQPLLQSDIFQFISNYRVKYEFQLAHSPRKSFTKFIDGVEKEILKHKANEKLNLFTNEDFRNKYAFDFKKATRFSPSDDLTATNLNTLINQLCENYKNNKIDIVKDIKIKSFYTDVQSIKYSISTILLSMIRHSKSKEILISITRNTSEDVLINISDTNKSEIDVECNRNELAHGKIRKVISSLNGVGNYYFIANFKSSGWKKIDLMKGDSVIDSDPMDGVTHLIKVPSLQ